MNKDKLKTVNIKELNPGDIITNLDDGDSWMALVLSHKRYVGFRSSIFLGNPLTLTGSKYKLIGSYPELLDTIRKKI